MVEWFAFRTLVDALYTYLLSTDIKELSGVYTCNSSLMCKVSRQVVRTKFKIISVVRFTVLVALAQRFGLA